MTRSDSDEGAAKPDLRELELTKFNEAIGKESEPTMLLLRAHLFSESLLERFIRLKLPRGDRVIENGGLSFAQKLFLVESLDHLDDSITSSLRNLNKLRNQCAHELGRAITDADVVRIGSPLGKFFTKTHRNSGYDPVVTLRGVVSYVCGYVTGVCHAMEEKRTADGEDTEPKLAHLNESSAIARSAPVAPASAGNDAA